MLIYSKQQYIHCYEGFESIHFEKGWLDLSAPLNLKVTLDFAVNSVAQAGTISLAFVALVRRQLSFSVATAPHDKVAFSRSARLLGWSVTGEEGEGACRVGVSSPPAGLVGDRGGGGRACGVGVSSLPGWARHGGRFSLTTASFRHRRCGHAR